MSHASLNKIINHQILHFTQFYFQSKHSLMLGPHKSPFYFCINQFHKSHHLELRNLIHIYFKTFLKIREDVKIACQKKKMATNFIKLGLLGDLENSRDE